MKLSLLDWLPGFSFKTSVNRLSNGGLHQVNISHYQRSVEVLEVLVELSIAQVIWERKQSSCNHMRKQSTRLIHNQFSSLVVLSALRLGGCGFKPCQSDNPQS